jgi:hypothetical protein
MPQKHEDHKAENYFAALAPLWDNRNSFLFRLSLATTITGIIFNNFYLFFLF